MLFIQTIVEDSQNLLNQMFGNLFTKAPLEFLGNFLLAVLGLIIGRLIVLTINKAVKKILKRNKRMSDIMRSFIGSVIDVIGWIIILVMFIQSLGINVGPIVAGLGVSGVILGLAFQETISNLFSGIMVIFNRPYEIGDYIECGSVSGTVSEMELMCTTLKTPDNRRITLLNSVIWNNPIINYSDMQYRRIDAVASVAYGTDLDIAKDCLRDLVTSYAEVVATPEPTIEVNKLSESSIDIIVRPWVKPEDYWKTYWRLQADIVKVLGNHNISIPFPQMDIHVMEKKN